MFNKLKNTRPEILELKINLVGEQVDRIAMRRDMLENVYDHENDDDFYDQFLDKLIASEESLIKDIS